jgi:hypothetical protein
MTTITTPSQQMRLRRDSLRTLIRKRKEYDYKN